MIDKIWYFEWVTKMGSDSEGGYRTVIAADRGEATQKALSLSRLYRLMPKWDTLRIVTEEELAVIEADLKEKMGY